MTMVAMPFVAASAPPCSAYAFIQKPTIDRAVVYPLTLFRVPPGYLPTESLAAALAEQQRPVLWLRLGPKITTQPPG